MSDQEIDAINCDAAQRLALAQACLDLFEKDRGRRAATTAEVREWAGAQSREHLQFRVSRRVGAGKRWAAACNRIWNNTPASLISRPPIGQRITRTLAEAAAATGSSTSAIFTAIKSGRITATRDMFGEWHVERAELHRLLPQSRSGASDMMRGSDGALDAAALVLAVDIAALIGEAGD